jgi:aldose 1-epimerase
VPSSPTSCEHFPTLYQLANASGFAVEVLPYGATIVSVRAPDRQGRPANVVLGLAALTDYFGDHPYLGAVAGRVAGRIGGARFSLDGKEYELAANDGCNHVHGGIDGFHRKLWSVESASAGSLRLSCLSPDGEEGYPGTVRAAVTYSVTDENALVMDIEATTDRATPFSLTQHSYFNLAGCGDILDHDLQILADAYSPMGPDFGLLGRREPVGDNDCRQPRRLRDAIPRLLRGHGDLYFLPAPAASLESSLQAAPEHTSPRLKPGLQQASPEPRALRTAAVLRHSGSGRVLTVRTDEDCLQLYTGAFLDGRPHAPHAGLCLECEGYPDALNSPDLGNITLRPGETFRRTTVYAFSTF